MNTYYLKKFRKAAKKHVKVEVYRDGYDGFLCIATNDQTRTITKKIVNLIPNRVICWLFPYGLLCRVKLYYARVNACFGLYENPLSPACLSGTKRETQVQALQDARRCYVKMLIRDERNRRYIYKQNMERVERKREMKKDLYELNRL